MNGEPGLTPDETDLADVEALTERIKAKKAEILSHPDAADWSVLADTGEINIIRGTE